MLVIKKLPYNPTRKNSEEINYFKIHCSSPKTATKTHYMYFVIL